MPTVITSLLAFPTVVFTALVGLTLLYWMFVIIGAADIDLFDVDGALDAGVDGALEGAAEGALEGAAEGLEGAAEGLEGAADGADGFSEAIEGKAGAAAGLLNALNLRRAPVTVVFSFVALFGWVFTFIGVRTLLPVLAAVLPLWLAEGLILVLAFVLALPLTSLATKPLEKVFRTTRAKHNVDFVGSLCRIQTGRVDQRFGQAILESEGTNLILQVRGDGDFKRGESALIVDYDAEAEAFIVEAYEPMLQEDGPRRKRR